MVTMDVTWNIVSSTSDGWGSNFKTSWTISCVSKLEIVYEEYFKFLYTEVDKYSLQQHHNFRDI